MDNFCNALNEFFEDELSKCADSIIVEIDNNIDKLSADDIDNIKATIKSCDEFDSPLVTKVKNDLQDIVYEWESKQHKELSPAEKLIEKYINERVCGFLGSNFDKEQLRLTLKDFSEYVLNS